MQPRKVTLDMGKPESVLFIGNSLFYYNNSLHNHVNGLRAKTLRCSSVTINGSSLSWHNVDSYFNPAGIGSYTVTADNEVVFNDPNRKLFDVAIMQDSTQGPLHPALRSNFFEYARKHSDTVRKHGAEPTFFMSWAYADRPEMTDQLVEAYTRAGNDSNALVIPAGVVFAEAVRECPGINLYQPDKRHPSLAGSYLAACTVCGALFGEPQEGNAYTAGLPADDVAALQSVAWNALGKYYKGI